MAASSHEAGSPGITIMVEHRFSALRTVAYIVRAIAILFVVVAIGLTALAVLSIGSTTDSETTVIVQIGQLWVVVMVGVVLLEAFAQLIFLAVSLEYNQRTQTEILRRLLEHQINQR
ncbi:MAG: hypothetical protein KME04_12060 [Pleurocapsa minor GSE-CHR-MK-17-07R]|jgi:ABC-type multidrug transport system fused ATPase/permease subunit|nr:hypothetical protein [Pleurocapsa minor GSE-CHR-MK 17-07R]